MAVMGRPRTFDRDEAVRQAMHLFWQHGYESTSIGLLKTHIAQGISSPSFYAAFKSKENLFREVIEKYTDTHGRVNRSLWDPALNPREAIYLALSRSAKMQTEADHPKGCLLVVSAATCAPENSHIQQLLASCRARSRNGFSQCVQRAIDIGDLPTTTDVAATAIMFHSFLVGLTMQARDGIDEGQLQAAVKQQMCLWDGLNRK